MPSERTDANGIDECHAAFLPPPSNDLYTGAIDIGPLECGAWAQYMADPEATPDPEATGNCIDDSEPAQWYTFTTQAQMDFNSFYCAMVGQPMEIFSTTTGCSNLVYEGFGVGPFYFELQPATTYYILVSQWLNLNVFIAEVSSRNNPLGIFPNIPWSNTNCTAPSDPVPCENDYVVWYSYSVACGISDIQIMLKDVDPGGPIPAVEISISVFLDDCVTLAVEYDVNGTGYVCSAVVNDESILLEDVPGGTDIYIAFGSDDNNTGDFDFSVIEDNRWI